MLWKLLMVQECSRKALQDQIKSLKHYWLHQNLYRQASPRHSHLDNAPGNYLTRFNEAWLSISNTISLQTHIFNVTHEVT